jgi:GNAT superfamily N-acetyltransferase
MSHIAGFGPTQTIARGSTDDLDKIWRMWQDIFPTWPVERLYLQTILSDSSARLYIFVTEGVAKIAIIGVLPTSRGQGVGTALIKHTREAMSSECRLRSFGTGSVFPRLWPGVPLSLSQCDRDFFIHRGLYSFRYDAELFLIHRPRFPEINRTHCAGSVQGYHQRGGARSYPESCF